MELHKVELQKVNVFFVFDRIVKDPDAAILKYCATKEKEKYKEILDMNYINTMELETLMVTLIDRKVLNPLDWASTNKKFDYEAEYKDLYSRIKNMYAVSKELPMCRIIKGFIHDFKIGKIYIWNETPDVRQQYEIVNIFPDGEKKIQYITGDYKKAIDQANPLLIYDWSAERVSKLNSYQEYNRVFFGIANYNFNFEDDDYTKLKYGLWDCNNVAFFRAMRPEINAKYKG